jgi:hypothetical protein
MGLLRLSAVAVVAIAAAWLLHQRPECPGPITGPQALPWVNGMRVACATPDDRVAGMW